MIGKIQSGLEICDNIAVWDRFCYESPEGSPFMQSWFAEAMLQSSARYFWYEDGSPKAGVLVNLESGKPVNGNFFVYHSLCFAKELTLEWKPENVTKRYSIFVSIIQSLIDIYPSELFLSLNKNISDIRPLLWYNYHKTEDKIFKTNIRYTAERCLTNFNNLEELLGDIRENRRRDYKKSTQAGIVHSLGASEDEVAELYRKTFLRQGILVEEKTIYSIKRLVNCLNEKRGYILSSRNELGAPVAVALVLVDARAAYSLIIANDPDYRNSGANTACMLEALLHAKNIGKDYFDFVGANSPHRGDFKISFKSDLSCYFESELQKI